MRLCLALILLASAASTPVRAAELDARSTVDAVTVFPGGAEVTRVAPLAVAAGEHTLTFEGLPGDLDPATIRVEGDGTGAIEIGSVDARLSHVASTDMDARRKALEAEIARLEDERAALDQVIADAEYQKGLMQQLATTAFGKPAKEGEPRSFGAGDLGELLDLVGGRLEVFSKRVTDSRRRQRDIDVAIADLHGRMAELAPQDQVRMRVVVHLAALAETTGNLRLRYRVANAGWQPIHDARLTSPDGSAAAKIELVRRAAITQATTESWDNVALTLSTARPVGATAAPELMPQPIDSHEGGTAASSPHRGHAALEAPAPASTAIGQMADEAVAAAEPKKDFAQREAAAQIAGFQALYTIPGRVSIDNTGTAKTVRIATSTVEATLAARAVPKLDPNAYLTAGFRLDGETPLLPGVVMLYRDGVFMGQGYLPLLSPGEEARLGFGVDDLIKVKRMEVKRLREEEGIITTANTDTRAYDITVKNLHGFAIPVTVLDQMPYAVIGDIKVETLPGMTPPTVRDFEKKRGILAWSFDLAPQAEKVLKHGFKVTWPRDMNIGMNLN